MNAALFRGIWDRSCTDIKYMTIEYPNYPIISLLTLPMENCMNLLRLRNSSFHFGTHNSPLQLNALLLRYDTPYDLCGLIWKL